ncbi:nitroreductase family protein, partial [Desulfococcaceae bacterium HSG8]|nr:nitroreductase family protein [Desulfococcaceae bacterium HSG8]
DVIGQRRAVNFFDPEKDVSEALLKQMIETAAKTPSGFNLQPWSLMIIKDMQEKLQLQGLAWNQPKVSEAPVVLIVLADRDAWKKDHPFLERNFNEMVKAGSMTEDQYQWFVDTCAGLYGSSEEKIQAFACKNTGFFSMSLMLAAKNLGLDTHPMDGFDHDGVRKAFNIPGNYWVPILLPVGYFREGEELSPPKWRKTFDEIVVKF